MKKPYRTPLLSVESFRLRDPLAFLIDDQPSDEDNELDGLNDLSQP